ncbi:MAG TPA: phytanoyl-CoA dioxygenase family protein [Candidatus Baltobacteraceae bacterium]|nr:phytanoyl-CoA dioxygenase family protein [Candidatus Baltobacteraceae bacterium]
MTIAQELPRTTADGPVRESNYARQTPEARRPPLLVRRLRMQPSIYSAICRARLLYSRRIAGSKERSSFRHNRDLLYMNDFERRQVESLRHSGYCLSARFFPAELVDRIHAKADAMFRNLQIDFTRAYSVQSGERTDLRNLSYEELAATEKMIAVADPLLHIPELLQVAFHESILKIAANFLGCIPPLYRVMVVRDFPHNRPLHSSNFHKDNDESDSMQIFIYLVDIDDQHGPLIYVPGSNHYDVRSCRPRLSRDLGIDANDGRLSDAEVERVYPRTGWAVLRTDRGSVAAIHGNGIHKGPAWKQPGAPMNQPRTAIRLDLHGHKVGIARDGKENRIRHADFEKLSELQRLFAHATIAEEDLEGAAPGS